METPMHKSTFSKLKLWILSVVGVVSLALVVQLTTQSASAAPAGVELSDAQDVVEITSGDGFLTLVTDFAAIQRDHTVNRTDDEVDKMFTELNGRMSELGWDMTNAEERNRLEIEAERVRTLLDIHNDTLIGTNTQTDMQKLKKVLEVTFSSTTCEGRCLGSPASKAGRTILFAAIAGAGTLALATTGTISIPAAAVGLVVAAVVTTAQVYFQLRDDIRQLDGPERALQRQMANNAMFAGMEVMIQNYDAIINEQNVIIDTFLNNLSEDVSDTSSQSGATPEEITDSNRYDLMDGNV
jgi:hypothetical protein